MKDVLIKSIFSSIMILICFVSFKGPVDDEFSSKFKNLFISKNEVVLENLKYLVETVDRPSFNIDSAKSILSECRRTYKSIEAFIIYLFPGDARKINRPIIAEMEEDDELGNYVLPHGFQYLEKLIYSDSARFFRKKIRSESNEIYSLLNELNQGIISMSIDERSFFEAMQMQLIRQFMLGLANFETTESRTNVQESIAVLNSFSDFLKNCIAVTDQTTFNSFANLDRSIYDAVFYLTEVNPYNDPNYFTFYSTYYIPISKNLMLMRKSIVPDDFYNTTAINYDVSSVFDSDAFNSFYFLPAKIVVSAPKVADLGRTLFFDPALSANNLRACASCHRADKGFTDGLPLSQSFEPGKMLGRNAPTIINSVYQRKLFHDGRVTSFEDQAGQVMSNPLEMHNDFSVVAVKLKTSPEYVQWFRSAFTGSKDTIITSKSILTAIAEYERTIVGMNSRFDKTISGHDNLLDEDEKSGFNIFMGKGNCASCHFLPLFNGTMPPEYVETEWEIIGTPSTIKSAMLTIDPDPGRAKVMNDKIFNHAFKVPTLRNISITGPYMHNGVFKSLEEVIEFYDAGGGQGHGYEVPFQTLSSDSLHLSQTEKFQLVAFLKTLTDTTNLTSRPNQLPSFPHQPALNNRPVGGNY